MAVRPASERWDLVVGYLSRNVAATDEVWLYPSDSALPLADVGQGFPAPVRLVPAPFPSLHAKGLYRAGWPAVVSVTPQQADAIASNARLRSVRVIWLVTRQSDIFDPQGDMPRALARVRRPGPVEQWGYVEVQPFYAR
jgi:hypothetical protein